MICKHATMIMLLAALIVGCRTGQHSSTRAATQVPVKIDLNPVVGSSEVVRLRSGQVIELKLGCPPVELRNSEGRCLRELDYTEEPQPLVAAPGRYSIVGFDPAGTEYAVQIQVTGR